MGATVLTHHDESIRLILCLSDLARRREPLGSAGKKLEVIRAAAQHDYPTADIDTMLAEIEMGYGTGPRP